MTYLLLALLVLLALCNLALTMRFYSESLSGLLQLRDLPAAAHPATPSKEIADSLRGIEESLLLHRSEIESDVERIGLRHDRTLESLREIQHDVAAIRNSIAELARSPR